MVKINVLDYINDSEQNTRNLLREEELKKRLLVIVLIMLFSLCGTIVRGIASQSADSWKGNKSNNYSYFHADGMSDVFKKDDQTGDIYVMIFAKDETGAYSDYAVACISQDDFNSYENLRNFYYMGTSQDIANVTSTRKNGQQETTFTFTNGESAVSNTTLMGYPEEMTEDTIKSASDSWAIIQAADTAEVFTSLFGSKYLDTTREKTFHLDVLFIILAIISLGTVVALVMTLREKSTLRSNNHYYTRK